MTINYTSLLGLAQPVTGTEANTWGTVVNDEITALIEEAVAGGVSINVTAGDVTMTDTDGNTNQARNAILLITGTPGTTRNVVAPSSSKVYIVRNGSDSAVVIKGAATTGVSVPSGGTSVVFWNGSDFQTNESMTELIVAAGAVGTPSITTAGDLNTGIFFPAADTIAFAEGGAEAMRIDSSGNVGIGTSSPSSIGAGYTTLHIEGSSGAGVRFVDTGATNYINYASSSDVDFYTANAVNFRFFNNASERMRIDSSGNVGIGTTAPSSALEVYLADTTYVRARENLTNKTVGYQIVANSGTPTAVFSSNTATGEVRLGGIATNYFQTFYTSNSERMRIDSSGNVGIGSTSPVGIFQANASTPVITASQSNTTVTADMLLGAFNAYSNDVSTTSSGGVGGIRVFASTAYNTSYSPSYMAFYTHEATPNDGTLLGNNIERMRITSSGYVGIGTTAPVTPLHVKGTWVNSEGILKIDANSGTRYSGLSIANNGSYKAFLYHDATDAVTILSVNVAEPLAFQTNSLERMRIDSSGNVGIGTTSPSYKLTVTSSSNAANNVLTGSGIVVGTTIGLRERENSNGISGTTYASQIYQGNSGGGHLEIYNVASTYGLVFGTNTTERARIISTGEFGIQNTNPSTGIPLSVGTTALGPPSPSTDTITGARISLYSNNRDHQLYMGDDGWGMCGNTQSNFVYKSGTNANNGDIVMAIKWGATGTGRVYVGTGSDYSGDSAGTQPRLMSAGGSNSSILGYTTSTSVNTAVVISQSASYIANGGGMLYLGCRTTAGSGWSFAGWYSDCNNTLDREFQFRGDGNGYCDGSWTGGGADYAEFFEWADGNALNEDRRGLTVVLDGEKIRPSTMQDDPSDVFGVISADPAVVGDAAWNKWAEKHLRDEFGSYVMEPYSVTKWFEKKAIEKQGLDGKPYIEYEKQDVSYQSDAIPANVVVPADAVVSSVDDNGKPLMRRKLNPNFDPTQEYTPRAERKEWGMVGLVGKLRIRKGQLVGDRWRKMRDINTNVEEWLVR